MASFTVKVRILGEAATSQAVNRALRDLNKLERAAARINKKAAGRTGRRRGLGGFQQPGVPTGGRGFSDTALAGGVIPAANEPAPRRRRPRGATGGVPPPIPERFGGGGGRQSTARRRLGLASTLGSLSGSAARITRSLGNLFSTVTREGIQFESIMAQVQIKTGATTKEMARLSAQAKRLGKDGRLLASAFEVGETQAFLGVAGFSTDQIEGATPALLRFAQANRDVDTAFAADFLSDIITPFDVISKSSTIQEVTAQFDRFADVLTRTGAKTNTGQRALSRALTKVAPIAAAAGFDIENVAASFGILAGSAIKGAEAGTVLRNVFLNIGGGSRTASKALKFIGLSFKSFRDEAGNLKPLTESLAQLNEALNAKFGADNKAIKQDLLKKVFGKRSAAGVLVLAKAATSGALAAGERDLRVGAPGEAARGAAKIADTTAGRLKAAESQVANLKLVLSETFIPVMIAAVESVTPLINGLAEFAAANPGIVKAAGIATAGLIALAGAITAVAGLGLIITGFGIGIAGIGTAIAATTTAVAAIGTGVGATIAGLAAGAAALVLVAAAAVAAGLAISAALGFFSDETGSLKQRKDVGALATEQATRAKFLSAEERSEFQKQTDQLRQAERDEAETLLFNGAEVERIQSARAKLTTLNELASERSKAGEQAITVNQKITVEDKRVTVTTNGETTVADTGRQTQGL